MDRHLRTGAKRIYSQARANKTAECTYCGTMYSIFRAARLLNLRGGALFTTRVRGFQVEPINSTRLIYSTAPRGVILLRAEI